MKRQLTLAILMSLALTGPACGGGGGGGPNFKGNYLFQTRLISDGCDLRLGAVRNILYNVMQDGDQISVENLATGAFANGTTIGNGWLATSSASEGTCSVSAQIAYDGATGGGVGFTGFCVGLGECSTEYDATVVRD